jgi:cell pole-organizing protein PopZ
VSEWEREILAHIEVRYLDDELLSASLQPSVFRMSAASPKMPDKAPDPSMEEILASIRRIIADDQSTKTDVAEPVHATLPPAENDDILDLAEVAQPVRKPALVPVAEPEVHFTNDTLDFDAIAFDDEPEPEPEPEPVFVPEPPRAAIKSAPSEPAERLTSSVTDASVGQAFNMLASTVLSNNARTLEDLVQDMLRPMLKGWLDEQLPALVERLVRAEIERVSRGR